jgi:hypothetical protein
MFRLSAPTLRLAFVLPLLALGSCGNNTGAIITVPNSVIAADLTGAKVLSVVTAAAVIDETGLTQKPGVIQVILNSAASPGAFAGQVDYDSSSAPPSGLAEGDLRGNGSHDLVVANLNAGTLSVFMETSPTSGAYGAPTTITVGGQPNDVQIADINGDGLPDLIVADNFGKVTYLLQNPASPGSFEAAVSLPITNPAITAEGLTTRAISVAVGDLNGDGFPDLAVTSFDVDGDNGQVTIYFQDPAKRGTFLPTPTVITALGEPSQIRIADMNQDGVNDIVIAMQGLGADSNSGGASGSTELAESQYGAMVILQNFATPGTFATPVVYAGASGAISLAVGDLNGDGLPDIAMTSLYPEGEGEIAVLFQSATSPGTFANIVSYSGLGQPSSIVLGDVTNDGMLDLITADATSATWLKNQSSAPGTFISQGQIGE